MFALIRRSALIIVLFIDVISAAAQKSEPNYVFVAKEFIGKIKRKQYTVIANEMTFPMRRHYPLPDIKSATEFVERHSEFLDDSLINMIIHSDPVEDWSQVGWRGVMFLNGTLWLDDDGILVAVNYEPPGEYKRRIKLVEEERATLHPSLQKYKNPKPAFETQTYTIRIDEMDGYTYRMCIWPKGAPMSQKPTIIIEGGNWIPEGSGGNNRFEFKQGALIYTCEEIVMGGDDTPPAEFVIMKGEDEILRENAIILRK